MLGAALEINRFNTLLFLAKAGHLVISDTTKKGSAKKMCPYQVLRTSLSMSTSVLKALPGNFMSKDTPLVCKCVVIYALCEALQCHAGKCQVRYFV